jgi:hypothetical protein
MISVAAAGTGERARDTAGDIALAPRRDGLRAARLTRWDCPQVQLRHRVG